MLLWLLRMTFVPASVRNTPPTPEQPPHRCVGNWGDAYARTFNDEDDDLVEQWYQLSTCRECGMTHTREVNGLLPLPARGESAGEGKVGA